LHSAVLLVSPHSHLAPGADNPPGANFAAVNANLTNYTARMPRNTGTFAQLKR